MQPSRKIILIGLRCSGKSTCGRLLSSCLKVPFIDLDDLTRARFPEKTIREIWSHHGEAGWRYAELAALSEVMCLNSAIIALGGGTPMIPDAFESVRSETDLGRAVVIYLRADAQTLSQRLRAEEGDRPSITGLHPADEIDQLLREREPTFRKLAAIEIRSDTLDPEEVVNRIVASI